MLSSNEKGSDVPLPLNTVFFALDVRRALGFSVFFGCCLTPRDFQVAEKVPILHYNSRKTYTPTTYTFEIENMFERELGG